MRGAVPGKRGDFAGAVVLEEEEGVVKFLERGAVADADEGDVRWEIDRAAAGIAWFAACTPRPRRKPDDPDWSRAEDSPQRPEAA